MTNPNHRYCCRIVFTDCHKWATTQHEKKSTQQRIGVTFQFRWRGIRLSLRQKDVRRKRGDFITHLDSHKRCDTQMVHMTNEMTSIRTRKKTVAVNENGRTSNDWLHEINCGRAFLTNTLALVCLCSYALCVVRRWVLEWKRAAIWTMAKGRVLVAYYCCTCMWAVLIP